MATISRACQIRSRRAVTLVEVLVVIAIIAALIGLVVPAVLRIRAAADRGQCANNLKQIGLALHNYHQARGRFPIGLGASVFWDIGGEGSWLSAISPFLEHNDVETQVFSEVNSILSNYLCPADPRENAGGGFDWQKQVDHNSLGVTWAPTSYLGVLGDAPVDPKYLAWANSGLLGKYVIQPGFDPGITGNGVFWSSAGTRVTDVTDGLSTTLMAGERPPSPDNRWGRRASALPFETMLWAVGDRRLTPFPVAKAKQLQAADGTPWEWWNWVWGKDDSCPVQAYFSAGDLTDYCHANHYWSFHPGGGNWLLCDGSVRFMTYDAGETVIPPMATISGGEVIPSDF